MWSRCRIRITAVYESHAAAAALRFVLADDPGAGKTIMAGLLIRELMVRGDLERCLVVAPGSLVEQWQDELLSKFNLSFEIFSRDSSRRRPTPILLPRSRCSSAAWTRWRGPRISARNSKPPAGTSSSWTRPNKLSASYFGAELKKTKRYQLGEDLGEITRLSC